MIDIVQTERDAGVQTLLRVPLDQLDIAPENLRAKEPADAEISELADTIAAADLLYPLLVRAGRKGEAAWMTLDGRRRLLALRVLVDDGRAAADRLVKVEVASTKAAQAAAIVISNTQRAPVHVADVIVAIGKLKSRKLTPGKIAAALGYAELEVRRLQRLAGLPRPAIEALKAGRITLRTAKLLARVSNAEALERFAQQAADGFLHEHSVTHHLHGRPGLDDPMFDLVGMDRYRAVGGRIDADLFGEFGDVVLDVDKLQGLWTERVKDLVEIAKARGLAVYFPNGELWRAPEEFETASPNAYAALDAEGRLAFGLASARTDELAQDLAQDERHPQMRDADLAGFLIARLDQEDALHGHGRIGAIGLYAEMGTGFEVQAYLTPHDSGRNPDDDAFGDEREEGADPRSGPASRPEIVVPNLEIATEPSRHSLHETYTDLATRGLIRTVADDPAAALTVMVARLFAILALQGGVSTDQSASTLQGRRYSRGSLAPNPALDGVVRDRLEARRSVYLESGLRPIPWVGGLAHGDKMALLAELTAISLDLKEVGVQAVRRAARAEAAEIAELTGHDITAYWTPDAGFLRQHSKAQLMTALAVMEADVTPTKGLRKDDLVGYVASVASEKGWAPASLNLRLGMAVTSDSDGEEEGSEAEANEPPQTAVSSADVEKGLAEAA